jgi:hypothetical protein
MNFDLWSKSRHPSGLRKVEGHLDFARCERTMKAEFDSGLPLKIGPFPLRFATAERT